MNILYNTYIATFFLSKWISKNVAQEIFFTFP